MPQWVFKYLSLGESPFVPLERNARQVVRVYNSFFDSQAYQETLVVLQLGGRFEFNSDSTITVGFDNTTYYMGHGVGNVWTIARIHNGFLYVPVRIGLPSGVGRIGGVFNPESLVPPKDQNSRVLVSEYGDSVSPAILKVVKGSLLKASRLRYFVDTDSAGGPSRGSLSDFFGFFGDIYGDICSTYFDMRIGPPLLDPNYSYEPYLSSADPISNYKHCVSLEGPSGYFKSRFRRYHSFFFVLPDSDSIGIIPMTGPTMPYTNELISPFLPAYFKVLFWLPKEILNPQGVNLIRNYSPPLNSRAYNYKFSGLSDKQVNYNGRRYDVCVTSDPSDRVSVIGWSSGDAFTNLTRSLDDLEKFYDMESSITYGGVPHVINPLFIGV